MQSLYVASGGLDAAGARRRIAVIGSGISGLSCAWHLGRHAQVTLYEQAERLGGHSNTVVIEGKQGPLSVDAGFIVYNAPAYPNLTALFAHLGVETIESDMSFAVSLRGGRLEYAGTDLRGLFAQRRNLLCPSFWQMLAEIMQFYRLAPGAIEAMDDRLSLGDWLDRVGPFPLMQRDHLLPMAAAIWSCPEGEVRDYPAKAFLRFCRNHGLLQVSGRPVWRTVAGGSARYVEALRRAFRGRVRMGRAITEVTPRFGGVSVTESGGEAQVYDEVVFACHAPQALAMLQGGSPALRATLGRFRTTRNHAVLHRDTSLLPRRRRAWSSWNVVETQKGQGRSCVTYWMNRLQALPGPPILVTLNPPRDICAGLSLRSFDYEHPLFDGAALAAQRALWAMQGQDGLWFAGAWLGAGFHEDGLQAGLAVAEALGAPARPWRVAEENGRMPGPAIAPQILRAA